MEYKELLLIAINASIKAGEEILKIYNTDFNFELKSDNSPLTLADQKSNDIIVESLSKTDFPLLSEEGKLIPYEERKDWEEFWLIDPLDGTKEFIKRNGEFTVNIALIESGIPVMGVIYVPVLKELYFAHKELGSFKSVNVENKVNELEFLINTSSKLPMLKARNKFTVVGSKSHMNEDTEEFISKLEDKHGEIEMISRGSSIKLCMVAEGNADIYPRYAPTMEWDTGAGHAIAKYAGASIIQVNINMEVVYNKQDLLNPWFVVSR